MNNKPNSHSVELTEAQRIQMGLTGRIDTWQSGNPEADAKIKQLSARQAAVNEWRESYFGWIKVLVITAMLSVPAGFLYCNHIKNTQKEDEKSYNDKVRKASYQRNPRDMENLKKD